MDINSCLYQQLKLKEKMGNTEKLKQIVSLANELELNPEDEAMILLVVVEGRVKPCIMGNQELLEAAISSAAKNSDDFKEIITNVVESLN